MAEKIIVTLTDEDARLLREVVRDGDYASASEVIGEALRAWRTGRFLGRIWDEGIASGPCGPGTTIDDIKAEARRRMDST